MIRPLAWEPPYATGAALKRQRKKKERKKNYWNSGSGGHEMHNFTNYCKTEDMGWQIELVGKEEILTMKKQITIGESEQGSQMG